MGEFVLQGLMHVFEPLNFMMMLMGIVIGMVVGAMPGLSGATAMTILLPAILMAPPDTSVLFLISIWCAAVYAGSISAICLNIPGTAAAAATTLDGFQLARQGLARKALRASIFGSALGGMASALALMLLSPPLGNLALSFGPAEMFAFAFFGMATVAALASSSLIAGTISTVIGLLIGTVGISPLGSTRLVYMPEMMTGFSLITVLLGVFTVPVALEMMSAGRASIAVDIRSLGKPESFLFRLRDWAEHWLNIVRSATIGVVVGVLPGAGPTIASFIAYGQARRFSKHPERFGKGEIAGVLAPETANNAAVFSSLVPALALGIPGSVDAVIIMAALSVHGLVPGPLFIATSPDVAYTVFVGALVANALMLIVGLFIARYLAKLTRVPQTILAPAILVLALMGSFAVHNDFFDVIVTLTIGIGVYLLRQLSVPGAPLILGAILGPMLETYFTQAVALYDGPLNIFIARPVAGILMLLAVSSLAAPGLTRIVRRRRRRRAAQFSTNDI